MHHDPVARRFTPRHKDARVTRAYVSGAGVVQRQIDEGGVVQRALDRPLDAHVHVPVPQILYLPCEYVIRLPHLPHETRVVSNRGRQVGATVQQLLGRGNGEREQGDARPQDQHADLRIGIHLFRPTVSSKLVRLFPRFDRTAV